MKFKMDWITPNDKESQFFTEENPPDWLTHIENEWFYNDCVLKLEVNEVIKSNYRLIERIE